MSQGVPPQVRHLVVEGLVQGVGFRWFARERARRFGLRGWVKNRGDGSVEIMAEGSELLLTQFVADLGVGPKGANVTNVRDAGTGNGQELPFPFAILR